MEKYFVSYRYMTDEGMGAGNISSDRPICSHDDVQRIEKTLERALGVALVFVTGWQKFEDAKPEIPEDVCDPELLGVAVIAFFGPHAHLHGQTSTTISAVEAYTDWDYDKSRAWLHKWQHLFCGDFGAFGPYLSDAERILSSSCDKPEINDHEVLGAAVIGYNATNPRTPIAAISAIMAKTDWSLAEADEWFDAWRHLIDGGGPNDVEPKETPDPTILEAARTGFGARWGWSVIDSIKAIELDTKWSRKEAKAWFRKFRNLIVG